MVITLVIFLLAVLIKYLKTLCLYNSWVRFWPFFYISVYRLIDVFVIVIKQICKVCCPCFLSIEFITTSSMTGFFSFVTYTRSQITLYTLCSIFNQKFASMFFAFFKFIGRFVSHSLVGLIFFVWSVAVVPYVSVLFLIYQFLVFKGVLFLLFVFIHLSSKTSTALSLLLFFIFSSASPTLSLCLMIFWLIFSYNQLW